MQARNILTNFNPSPARHENPGQVKSFCQQMCCSGRANVSHLDENIAALLVWLNSSKPDDLRTNAFSTSTKCKSQGKNIFWICWPPLLGHYKKLG